MTRYADKLHMLLHIDDMLKKLHLLELLERLDNVDKLLESYKQVVYVQTGGGGGGGGARSQGRTMDDIKKEIAHWQGILEQASAPEPLKAQANIEYVSLCCFAAVRTHSPVHMQTGEADGRVRQETRKHRAEATGARGAPQAPRGRQ